MDRGIVALALVFVALPWVVILGDAAVGLNFFLALAMLFVFALGVLFLAAAASES